jgi:Tol biopolymer transport system component
MDWTPGGDWILFSSDRTGSGDAWIVPVEDGKARGEPALVKRDFGRVSSITGVVPMGFAQDGSFYYTVRSDLADVYIAVLDPEKAKVSTPAKNVAQRFEGTNCYPAWSPDGKYLAYTSERQPGGLKSTALCLLTVDTGEYRELFPDLRNMFRMSWFPDGESVLVVQSLVVSGGIHRVNVKTAGVRTLVTDGSGFHSPRCTPDGKKVLYEDDSWQDRVFRIMSYDVESGQKKEIYRSSQQIIRMDISPDGKWLAFLEWADSALKVMPPDGGQPRVLYKFEGDWSTSVAWSPDGKYIYFTRGSNGKMGRQELWRIPSAGGEPVRFDLAADGSMENLDIHPDGRRIAFDSARPGRDVWVMENFLPKRKDD